MGRPSTMTASTDKVENENYGDKGVDEMLGESSSSIIIVSCSKPKPKTDIDRGGGDSSSSRLPINNKFNESWTERQRKKSSTATTTGSTRLSALLNRAPDVRHSNTPRKDMDELRRIFGDKKDYVKQRASVYKETLESYRQRRDDIDNKKQTLSDALQLEYVRKKFSKKQLAKLRLDQEKKRKYILQEDKLPRFKQRNNKWKSRRAKKLSKHFIDAFEAPIYKKDKKDIAFIQKAMNQTVILKCREFDAMTGNDDATTADVVASRLGPAGVKSSSSTRTTKRISRDHSSGSTSIGTGISRKTANAIIDAMEDIDLVYGDYIPKQEQMTDNHFYIVKDGQVNVEVGGRVVRTAQRGDIIFDLNLLHDNDKHAITKIVASSHNKQPTKLYRLDQKTYRGIMETTCQQERKHEHEERFTASIKKGTQEGKSDGKNTYETTTTNLILQHHAAIREAVASNVQLDDLERISILGEGQFGEVWLVEAKLKLLFTPPSSSAYDDSIGSIGSINDAKEQEQTVQFALKIQYKVSDDGGVSQEAIRQEINTLQEMQHPFICNLVHVYEDQTSLYMLMGLVSGGELWDMIHREDPTTGDWVAGLNNEDQARFYTLVLADTLGYIHSKQYIFRDLKPENVMIDSDGYPILIDFGFAKQLQKGSAKTFTFCGTPNYVAPEIIQNRGHNAGADYWALGVVIYEMLDGENPFYYDGMETMQLYQSICEEDYYPLKEEHKSSPQVAELIQLLLTKDDKHHLGMLDNGVNDILEHEWLGCLDLDKIRRKDYVPPWVTKPSATNPKEQAPHDSSGDASLTFVDANDNPEPTAEMTKEIEVQVGLVQAPLKLVDDESLKQKVQDVTQISEAEERSTQKEDVPPKHGERTKPISEGNPPEMYCTNEPKVLEANDESPKQKVEDIARPVSKGSPPEMERTKEPDALEAKSAANEKDVKRSSILENARAKVEARMKAKRASKASSGQSNDLLLKYPAEVGKPYLGNGRIVEKIVVDIEEIRGKIRKKYTITLDNGMTTHQEFFANKENLSKILAEEEIRLKEEKEAIAARARIRESKQQMNMNILVSRKFL